MIAVLVLTPIFLVISDVTTGLLRPPGLPLHVTSLIVSAVANAIVAAVLAPLVIGLKRRSEQRERVLWWR